MRSGKTQEMNTVQTDGLGRPNESRVAADTVAATVVYTPTDQISYAINLANEHTGRERTDKLIVSFLLVKQDATAAGAGAG